MAVGPTASRCRCRTTGRRRGRSALVRVARATWRVAAVTGQRQRGGEHGVDVVVAEVGSPPPRGPPGATFSEPSTSGADRPGARAASTRRGRAQEGRPVHRPAERGGELRVGRGLGQHRLNGPDAVSCSARNVDRADPVAQRDRSGSTARRSRAGAQAEPEQQAAAASVAPPLRSMHRRRAQDAHAGAGRRGRLRGAPPTARVTSRHEGVAAAVGLPRSTTSAPWSPYQPIALPARKAGMPLGAWRSPRPAPGWCGPGSRATCARPTCVECGLPSGRERRRG